MYNYTSNAITVLGSYREEREAKCLVVMAATWGTVSAISVFCQ